MKYLLIAVVSFIVICIIVLLVVRELVRRADHYEMLNNAIADYLTDSYNFDITHYPDITEEEIINHIKRLSERKK